jgi:hypothetical protein
MTPTATTNHRELSEAELDHVVGGYGPGCGHMCSAYSGFPSGSGSTGTGTTLAHETVHAS